MIHAKSGDTYFVQQIVGTLFKGNVHSVFKHALNIRNLENGEIFTLATKEMDNAPNTIILSIDNLDNLHIEQNDSVYVEKNQLFLMDKLQINIENINKWQCDLPPFPSDVTTLEKNVNYVKAFIEVHGKSGGIKRRFPPINDFDAETSQMLEERTHFLQREIMNNSTSNFQKYALDLVGLGPGLTPSGDDFLVGLFTVFNLENGPCFSYKPLCEKLVEIARPLTNDISYTTLKKAAYGNVRESINSLVHALLHGSMEDSIESLKSVLSIGSSSGTDIALGLLSGLEANIKLGG
ncbi:DUF2877 domain-containing protein [Lysinibacillus xylanilyticus]|uniref:DUF2877 domain-containing protein n=1 Tax=Lysinibacillus xylanilyticus TaxID=582475 RepID=UPI003D090521